MKNAENKKDYGYSPQIDSCLIRVNNRFICFL